MHAVLIDFRDSTPYSVQLANALGQSCQVTLMLRESASKFSGEIDQNLVNLEFFRQPRYRQPANLMAMVWHLRHRLKVLRPDLVHITAWNIWGSPGLGIFAPCPLVATVHDVNRHPGGSGLTRIPSVLYRWQWRWADQVIVHATTARTQLITQYRCQPERVHVIPIGSYDFYRTVAHNVQPERTNTLLFFGRIWEYKGLNYLIEAEPLITEAFPDARIIIAGHGENFERYRQTMINPNHFEVYNYRIPEKEVAHFFQQASVVVLPYIEASQSGVIPLAYAFGKPIVATTVGGIPEIVEDGITGYLVPPRDSDSLANAIIRLLQDKELRQRMGQNALEKTRNEISWTTIARQTMEVYQAAIDG